MVRRIWIIAGNTLLDVARHKMLSIHLIFVLIALGLFNLFSHFSVTPELEYRMIQDVGISVIAVCGLMMTLFIGVATLREELNRRTAYAALTLPMARWEFYLGKFLGTLGATVVNIVIMVIIFATLLYAKFGLVWHTFFWVVLFMSMEFAIVSSLVLLFSLSDSTVLAFSFTFFMVVMGNLVDYVKHLVEEAAIPLLSWLTWAAYLIIPNFGYFNIKARILKSFSLPPELVGWAVTYCLLYVAFSLVCGILLMNRRDL